MICLFFFNLFFLSFWIIQLFGFWISSLLMPQGSALRELRVLWGMLLPCLLMFLLFVFCAWGLLSIMHWPQWGDYNSPPAQPSSAPYNLLLSVRFSDVCGPLLNRTCKGHHKLLSLLSSMRTARSVLPSSWENKTVGILLGENDVSEKLLVLCL